MPSPRFAVNTTSGANDLLADSSDFPGRKIAEKIDLFGLGFEIRYVPNPTATDLSQALVPPQGGNAEHRLVNGFAFPAGNTEVMYVVTPDGRLVFGTRPHDVRRPHPTLVGDADPEVLNGGTITMKDGLIWEVRDDSGHHMPGYSGIDALLRAFAQVPRALFHPQFQGFKPFGSPAIHPEFARATRRNEMLALQRDLRSRAVATAQSLTTRIRSNRSGLANVRVTGNQQALLTILGRHDALFQEVRELLADLVFFAREYVVDVDQATAARGIGQARALLTELDSVSRIVDVTDPGTITLAIRAQNEVFEATSQALISFTRVPDLV